MSARWKSAPLRQLCEFHNGLWTGKKPPFQTARVIRNTNFTTDGKINLTDVAVLQVEQSQFAKRRLRKGDIIIEKSGGGPKQPVGRVVLYDLEADDFSFSNFTSVIRTKDRGALDPDYLHRVLYFWYVSGVTEPLQRRSTGIRNLDFDSYKNLEVPLPPLDEQKRIVAALDRAFAALDRARANAEVNLQDARQLRSQSIEDLLSDPQLGEPEPCGDHIELLVGFAFSSSGYTDKDDDIRLVRGDNIVQGAFRWNGVKRWPAGERTTYEKYELARGDVLVAMDRTWISAGIKYAVVDDEALPSLLVQRVARLRAKPSIDPRYLAAWIGSPMFERYVLSIQTGLGVPHVSGGQLESFRIRVPSLDLQSRVIDRLAQLSDNCESLQSIYQRSTEDIAALRQCLLQAAFSGQLN
ncbi:MAG: hypothetical protein C6Y20_18835 [Tagaea sp. CACIAM 22H2]|nr:hypothetical protein [Tagaea sp. CACIAM 22H2]